MQAWFFGARCRGWRCSVPSAVRSAAAHTPNLLWHKSKQISLNHSRESNGLGICLWLSPGVTVGVKTSFFSLHLSLSYLHCKIFGTGRGYFLFCACTTWKIGLVLFLRGAVCSFNLLVLSTRGGEYWRDNFWLMVSSKSGRNNSRISGLT